MGEQTILGARLQLQCQHLGSLNSHIYKPFTTIHELEYLTNYDKALLLRNNNFKYIANLQ